MVCCTFKLFVAEVSKVFYPVLNSQDAKSSTPEAAIFDFAAAKSGLGELSPNQILHIGDDLDKEIIFFYRLWPKEIKR